MNILFHNADEVILSRVGEQPFMAVFLPGEVFNHNTREWHIYFPCHSSLDRCGWRWIGKTEDYDSVLGLVAEHSEERSLHKI